MNSLTLYLEKRHFITIANKIFINSKNFKTILLKVKYRIENLYYRYICLRLNNVL